METKKDILNRLFVENDLTNEDVFSHQHYKIITRAGIDKIQANMKIRTRFEVIKCEPNFAVVKAQAELNQNNEYTTIETFGSALKALVIKTETQTLGMLWKWLKNVLCQEQF